MLHVAFYVDSPIHSFGAGGSKFVTDIPSLLQNLLHDRDDVVRSTTMSKFRQFSVKLYNMFICYDIR